ncbi:MAG: response regulator transcription factor [Nitrospira sp.]|uniref:Response regulator, LuxR family n=1 Tax=Candidatus Nitrospira inopinata TaxID=1715989 RepID=A0A0S4KMS4_9BACT|nr:response regulator transcription factor [Candidatus Nitrospira inopinata]MCP9452355.1 response regulator transcription factor [Nitrospira sp.]MCP9464559.1 response regulator transcription factor [Nitrospira sp.]CUQ65671.1 Response regulator, LuxR family [Candidatus Nitrospira inopinata]
MKKPRVLLADDHALVLAGLRRLVEDSCEVVGTVEDGRSLIEAAQRLEPDLILLDIAMPLLNGIDAARQIRKLCPDTKLIFLTMQTSPTYATEAFQAGASGYLLKRSAPMELPLAIEAVLRGQHYLTPAIAKPVLERALKPDDPSTLPIKGSPADLTPRQREVLQLIGEGKATKEIAALLNISVKTVEFHKARLMEELGFHSTAELMRYAIAQGLANSEL